MRTVLRQGLLAACLLVCLSCSLAHAEQHMRGLKVQPGSAVKANSVFASDMAELKSFMDRQTSVNTDTQATPQQSDEETQFGGRLLYHGPEYATFDRPLPDAVEKTLFKQFEEYFNQTQAFSAEGPNTFSPTGRQVVAVVTNGRVSGVLGDVRNAQGDLLTSFATAPEGSIPKEAAAPCRRFKRLATAIQKYGHMYHHFVLEVLPRVILLRPYLDADTKVLLFGSAHEAKWLAALGIAASQVEVYDPSVEYCADELLVPSMSPIITPPKENYELLQAAFQAGVSSLDDESTDLIVYCSRRDAHDRVVANEAQLLALIRERYPTSELFVYTGRESVEETIRIFRRASVVVGMHGAGLSHIVFAPRGAAVVEFLFMPDPPMMFWHAASALQQHYIMVPLAQSWWLERSVTVPAQDVLDALAIALGAPQGDCPLGQYKWGGSNECVACPSGTYRPAGATSCMPCAPGRHSTQGASFCSTCEADTYSDDSGFTCLACPSEAVTLFPGSSSASQCISVEAAEAKMRAMFNDDVLASKLVDMPALENDKPKTAAGWLVAAMSPSHWQRIYLRKQLRQQYLKQLFNTDEAQAADEEWDDADEGSRRQMLQYGASRHMLQYGASRHMLQYGSRRHMLQYGASRHMLQYGASRHMLQWDGYGSHHRHMLQWDGYSHRRSVLQFGYHRRRHMLQYH